jgi:hypothetical protein
MRDRDPFSKVVETIGLYYLDWVSGEFVWEEQINMKSLERVCSTGRFEVMASCVSPQREGTSWPDKAILKINGETVFEVPPLLVDHCLRRRRDTAHFITPYIFQDSRSESMASLERTRFSL